MTFELPARKGDPPEVGPTVPQLQFTQQSPPEIKAKLAEWSFGSLPDVREEPTRISVPTSRALWLHEDKHVAHEDAFMPPSGSREFCHLHEDGSIHARLPDDVSRELLAKGWGVVHPLDPDQWLVHAPRDDEELVVMKYFVSEAYRYVTGHPIN